MTYALIQARLASSRFPNKALADIHGQPMIRRVCSQVLKTHGLDEVVLVCPPCDLDTFAVALSGLPVRLAPTQTVPVAFTPTGEVAAWDVLGAMWEVVRTRVRRRGGLIVRVTGDCPCLDPEAVRLTIDLARFVGLASSEHEASGWPDGTGCEVFQSALLEMANHDATWPKDREHPTRWIFRNADSQIVENPHGDFGHLRLSVNVPADLTRVREYLQAQRQPIDAPLTSRTG